MNIKLALIIFISSSIHLLAQNSFEMELDSISNEYEASEFLTSNEDLKGKIIVFNTEKHNTKLASEIFNLPIGGKKSYKSDNKIVYYKVLEKQSEPHFRMGYIFFDRNELTQEDYNKKIALIRDRLIRGQKFFSLASQFSMDNTAFKGGDSGWFKPGSYFNEVENALESKRFLSGELMEVDVPSKNYTFVIYKTHNKKLIEEYKVLKMTDYAK